MKNNIKKISREDLMPVEIYATERESRRKNIIKLKRNRRINVGPIATFYFENYDTMLFQILEMLYIEKGGENQIQDELSAYNPLIPQGHELVATFMIEIPNENERLEKLRQLTGIEKNIFLIINGEEVVGIPEVDQDRTDQYGKTSAVHFVRFKLNKTQVESFKEDESQVTLHIKHSNYSYSQVLSSLSKISLKHDLNI